MAAQLACGALTLPAFREALCRLLRGSFGVSRASLWGFTGDGDKRSLHCVGLASTGAAFHASGAVLHASEFGLYFEQLLSRGVYVAHDVMQEPALAGLATYFARTGVRSLLDTSFQINGRPFGVVCLEETGRVRTWTAQEAAALRQAASTISLSVARLGPTFDFGVASEPA